MDAVDKMLKKFQEEFEIINRDAYNVLKCWLSNLDSSWSYPVAEELVAPSSTVFLL